MKRGTLLSALCVSLPLLAVSARVPAVSTALAIQASFELEILGDDSAPGRRRLQHLFDSLMRQADALTGAAAALGLELRSDR